MSYYGESPVDLGELLLPEWQEFMHYMYLPVRIPYHEWNRKGSWDGIPRLPERLEFLREPVLRALRDSASYEHLRDPYVYVTARRGFATPGNPLNRPGYHCDDYGGTDLNYVWTDAFPTSLLLSDSPLAISENDDAQSMDDMKYIVSHVSHAAYFTSGNTSRTIEKHNIRLEDAPLNRLLRLSPYVVHSAPEIEEGGIRSFLKISVSSHRYNLIGNSHNYLLNYDWKMYDRAEVRNQPGGNGDYVKD